MNKAAAYLDLPPDAVAQLLGGRVVAQQRRKGQWIAVIELPQEREAKTVIPTELQHE